MKLGKLQCAAASLAVAVMAGAPVAAKKANSLRDLNGSPAAGAERELQRRGFEYQRGDRNDYSSITYWWDRGDKDCVAVETMQGRVVSINDAKNSDCGQSGSGGSDVAVAAGVIGAVALGAILLSRKDKDKHREQYNQDWQMVEVRNTQSGRLRIFRNPDKNARVQQEVREGTQLRNNGCDQYNGEVWCEVSTINGRTTGWARDRYLRPVYSNGGGWNGGGNGNWNGGGNGGWNGGNGGNSGYYQDFSDLNGARAASADNAMRQRGFRNVDGFRSGSTAYSIWYRYESRQCVQMAVADGRVQNIVDIQTHPSCR